MSNIFEEFGVIIICPCGFDSRKPDLIRTFAQRHADHLETELNLPKHDAPPEPAAGERCWRCGRTEADRIYATCAECFTPPPAPDRIGELEAKLNRHIQFVTEEEIRAWIGGMTDLGERLVALERSWRLGGSNPYMDTLIRRVEALEKVSGLYDSAPAAQERGEAITLHRWVNGSGRGQWTECVTPCKPWMDTQVSAWKHRTARFDAPAAQPQTCGVDEIMRQVDTRHADGCGKPDGICLHPDHSSPAPRDDGPGERETFARAALKIALGHKHSTACQTGDDPHADCASVVGDAIVDAFVPPATAKQAETCYCGAPKQTCGGHPWNPALGCGSEPLNPDTWPPKQPEQSAPEARRWTLNPTFEGPRVEGPWINKGVNVIDAAYHDAAMAQAKKDREAVVEVERIVDWLKHDLPYRAPELVGPDYAAELFKRLQRALGGPR